MFITDTEALATFCRALRGVPYLAVDTEFVRERTYFPVLCLVQVAHGPHAAVIDALAPGIDLAPLWELLTDRGIVKVIHAATQDLEIFLEHTGQVPAPIFDTQIAATVCDLGEQPGYARLVEAILGIHIDKASQVTDWSLRPLTERQLDYALADVVHLCPVYERIQTRLQESGRAAWVAEDMHELLDPRRYRVEPREAWQRIKLRRPKRKMLSVLRELCAWREETAMARDLPRSWVLKDEAIVEIAQTMPTTRDALLRVRKLAAGNAKGPDGDAILAAVARGLACPPEQMPVPPEVTAAPTGHENLVALLRALLRVRSEEHGVAMRMLATREDLDLLATEEAPDIPCMHGWRRRLFGDEALLLRAGRLGLTGRAGGVEIFEIAPD